MSKKIFWLISVIVIFSLVFSFSLAGCKKEVTPVEETTAAAEETTAAAEETTAAAPTEPLKVLFEMETGFYFPWRTFGLHNWFLYDRLAFADENLVATYPALAEEWSISEDVTEGNIKLRDDIYWHDGEKITPDDIVWSLETAAKSVNVDALILTFIKKIEGVQEFISGDADNISGIEVDGLNIKIKLTEAYTFNDFLGQFAPLPKHLLENEEPEKIHLSEFWMQPIGSGPYKIVERAVGDYTLLEPHELYYKGVPKIDQIMFSGKLMFPDLARAEAGEIDWQFGWNIEESLRIDELEHMKATAVTVPTSRYFIVNQSRPYWKDVNVRKALTHAIDIEALVKEFFLGYAEVTPVLVSGEFRDTSLEPLKYNPGLARQLLEEANWDFNREIDFAYYYTDKQSIDMMATMVFYLEQIGLKVKPRLLTGNVGEILYTTKDFDICYAAYGAPSWIDLVAANFVTGGIGNTAYGIEIPGMTEAYLKYKSSIDQNVQKAALDEAQRLFYEYLPYIPLFGMKGMYVESDRLIRPEWYASPNFSSNWEIEKWEIVK